MIIYKIKYNDRIIDYDTLTLDQVLGEFNDRRLSSNIILLVIKGYFETFDREDNKIYYIVKNSAMRENMGLGIDLPNHISDIANELKNLLKIRTFKNNLKQLGL